MVSTATLIMIMVTKLMHLEKNLSVSEPELSAEKRKEIHAGHLRKKWSHPHLVIIL